MLHLGHLCLIVQLHFSKLFLILTSGVNPTIRGSIRISTLASIKLRKCSSKIIKSILSFISGRLATESNQIKFFFSSRRRHTRSLCDWSSDVCSSDLDARGDPRAHIHLDGLDRAGHRDGGVLAVEAANGQGRGEGEEEDERADAAELQRPRHQSFGSRIPTFFLSSGNQARAMRSRSAAVTARIFAKNWSFSAWPPITSKRASSEARRWIESSWKTNAASIWFFARASSSSVTGSFLSRSTWASSSFSSVSAVCPGIGVAQNQKRLGSTEK